MRVLRAELLSAQNKIRENTGEVSCSILSDCTDLIDHIELNDKIMVDLSVELDLVDRSL